MNINGQVIHAFIGLSEAPSWLFKEEIYGQLNKISNYAENYKLFVESIGQDEKMIEFYSKERMDPGIRWGCI